MAFRSMRSHVVVVKAIGLDRRAKSINFLTSSEKALDSVQPSRVVKGQVSFSSLSRGFCRKTIGIFVEMNKLADTFIRRFEHAKAIC